MIFIDMSVCPELRCTSIYGHVAEEICDKRLNLGVPTFCMYMMYIYNYIFIL